MAVNQSTRHEPSGSAESRRGFLAKLAAVTAGGLATLAPVAVGVWAFLDPLRRKGAIASFLPVTELSAIPDDGVPRQFAVVAERIDAWTGFPREPIGAVYLRREKGSQQVEALSATCPHAGCFVELEGNARSFRCPCHNSMFTLDGGIVEPSPSPRTMDSLECRVGPGGEVAVKWENFYSGIAEKKART
jgi:menaquinol-cytochrome c reductase iron-sulfur subunit